MFVKESYGTPASEKDVYLEIPGDKAIQEDIKLEPGMVLELTYITTDDLGRPVWGIIPIDEATNRQHIMTNLRINIEREIPAIKVIYSEHGKMLVDGEEASYFTFQLTPKRYSTSVAAGGLIVSKSVAVLIGIVAAVVVGLGSINFLLYNVRLLFDYERKEIEGVLLPVVTTLVWAAVILFIFTSSD